MFGRKKQKPEAAPPSHHLSPREHERLFSDVYRMVSCDRHGDAIYLLTNAYDYLQTPTQEFEKLYAHVMQWGPSRTLLCLGRLIIYRLHREKRYARAITWIEKCQQINPKFLLPELSRVTFYARQAIDSGQLRVAKNLITDHEARYGDLVGSGECDRLLQLIEPDIDLSEFQ